VTQDERRAPIAQHEAGVDEVLLAPDGRRRREAVGA
jgi:hypothetical protein